MNLTKATLSAAAIAAFSMMPAQAAISILAGPGVTTGTGPGGGGDKTIQTGYTIAATATKLVVVLGGEHGFSGNTGGDFNTVTFSGTELVRAAHEGTTTATIGIFYLDSPSGSGDIVVNQANHNASPYAIFQLTDSAPGHGGAGAGPGSAASSSITLDSVPAADSLVVVGVHNSGPAGGNFPAAMTADSPLTEVADRVGNTRWNTLDVATAVGGTGTYSFSGANATDELAFAGVEFTNVPEPSALALVGLGSLLIIRRRR